MFVTLLSIPLFFLLGLIFGIVSPALAIIPACGQPWRKKWRAFVHFATKMSNDHNKAVVLKKTKNKNYPRIPNVYFFETEKTKKVKQPKKANQMTKLGGNSNGNDNAYDNKNDNVDNDNNHSFDDEEQSTKKRNAPNESDSLHDLIVGSVHHSDYGTDGDSGDPDSKNKKASKSQNSGLNPFVAGSAYD
ncbi:hypothetical protein RFI_05350 [Reticulomyxa filosa]|uniref:Uncharacterized protein n=1 Tax=Reticulomyxa filosa TaxID=46433 RepID=X6P0W0_RETFI|nr:hypothetical protein RFI_05350 [Reticulomyxa filosa]|eukprot:ETO31768.1 hypothetical protein RFI_05350 [Reticulomyxa filosa]